MVLQKGLYLYCVRKKDSPPVKVVKTIGGGKVILVPFKDLEAVVSRVDLERFGSEEIQIKAQEDVNWIKGKAQVHEHVVERAMEVRGEIVAVIPMKFGAIFKTKKSLEGMIGRSYGKFRIILEDLKGKQERGVKVYLNEDLFAKHLEKGKDLAQKEKEIASLPRGVDFFARKELDKIVEGKKIKELESQLGRILESLQGLSVKVRYGKVLDKALTGKKEPMVLNVSFLVKGEKVGKFQKEAGKLRAQCKDLGLEIQASGPWPPYNFCEAKITETKC